MSRWARRNSRSPTTTAAPSRLRCVRSAGEALPARPHFRCCKATVVAGKHCYRWNLLMLQRRPPRATTAGHSPQMLQASRTGAASRWRESSKREPPMLQIPVVGVANAGRRCYERRASELQAADVEATSERRRCYKYLSSELQTTVAKATKEDGHCYKPWSPLLQNLLSMLQRHLPRWRPQGGATPAN